MKRINSNLLKFLGIFSALSAVVVLFIFKFWPLFFQNSIYYCQSFLSGSLINIPPIFHTLIFTTAFFLFVAILIKILLVLAQGYRFKRNLNIHLPIEKKLSLILEELDLKDKVKLAVDNKPFAFCLGIRNPVIYISTKTVKIMKKSELKAILLHEKYHLQKRDGMIMLIASLTKLVFPFFPLISDLIERYKLEREVKADKEVVSIAGKGTLVSVLTKLLTFPNVPMLTASAIADSETVESRIKSILYKQDLKLKYKKINVFISLTSLVLFTLFLVIPVQATELNIDNKNTMMVCVNDKDCAIRCRENTHLINQKIDSSYRQNISYPFTPVK